MTDDTYRLSAISDVRSSLIYAVDKVPGAMRHAFLNSDAAKRLGRASLYLRENYPNRPTLELLVWDAYRTIATQTAIFESYAEQIMDETGVSYERATVQACKFVSSPSTIFPHGTGGAVDITLIEGGRLLNMGTNFDSFTPQSAADWYGTYSPESPHDIEAANNRSILRMAMESAGFVVLDSEWWHFEWGTQYWSNITGQAAVLDSICHERPELGAEQPGPAQPSWSAGATQIFTDRDARASALRGESKGHFYGRASSPSVAGLGKYYQSWLVPVEEPILTANGLAASTNLLRAVVPNHGAIIYDEKIYYEIEKEILTTADEKGWIVVSCDFSNAERLGCALDECHSKGLTAVGYCDSPRNWWLDALDIRSIGEQFHQMDGVLAVDTTLQPLQNFSTAAGADFIVTSLSKYPSCGMALGGVICVSDDSTRPAVVNTVRRFGSVMSPETATTVWTQIVTLRDRMTSISAKTAALAEQLLVLPSIAAVRIPDSTFSGGLVGGQIGLDLACSESGFKAELLIGQNCSRPHSAVQLAYTFGASMTTFEHFYSNPRPVSATATPVTRRTADQRIQPGMCRVGVGYEPIDRIFGDLEFFLESAHWLAVRK